MGVCTSEGVILDFAGPYYISVDDLAFGHPTRHALPSLWMAAITRMLLDRCCVACQNK
jgi:hypothetical protein